MAEVPQSAEEREAVCNSLLRQAKAACAAGFLVEQERVHLEFINFIERCQLHDVRNENTRPDELAFLEEAVSISNAGLKTLAAKAAAAGER